jgi:hypothetical protein
MHLIGHLFGSCVCNVCVCFYTSSTPYMKHLQTKRRIYAKISSVSLVKRKRIVEAEGMKRALKSTGHTEQSTMKIDFTVSSG